MNEAKKQQAPAVASPPVRQLCAFRSFVLPGEESRSRSSLKTKRRAKKRFTYSLLVLCFFNHTSLRKRATGSAGDQTDQSASERRDPTGGGELLDRLERPQEASRGVIREASASARHSSPARSLYATKSRPQVRGPRSTIERPSSRARRGGASRAGTQSLRARFSGRIDRTAIRLPQCRRASLRDRHPFERSDPER